jgi:hypothetical protein
MERHGYRAAKSPTYKSWCKMRERCNNPNTNRAKSYFLKGITYDPRWDSFLCFVEDMGERPENTSLDRIDNSKGYFKENCRWATRIQQGRNTSRNVFYSINGINYCQEEAKNVLGWTIKKLRYMRELNRLPENVFFVNQIIQ